LANGREDLTNKKKKDGKRTSCKSVLLIFKSDLSLGILYTLALSSLAGNRKAAIDGVILTIVLAFNVIQQEFKELYYATFF